MQSTDCKTILFSPEAEGIDSSFANTYRTIHEIDALKALFLASEVDVLVYVVSKKSSYESFSSWMQEQEFSPAVILVDDSSHHSPEISHRRFFMPLSKEVFKKHGMQFIESAEHSVLMRRQLADARAFIPRLLHEIKNPSVLITAALDEIKESVQSLKIPKEHNFRIQIEKLDRAHNRMNEVMSAMAGLDSNIRDKQNYSMDYKTLLLNVNASIEAVRAQYQSCPEINITGTKELEGREISFQQTQLQQIVVNLLKNAFQASEDPTATNIRIEISLGEQDYIVLSVIDNGPGVPEKIRSKIFRSSFSTKKKGENANNAGIGLAVCRKIAHQNKAELMLDTSSEETKFDLLIPFAA